MATNSTERLVAIWNRENPLFPVHRQHRDKTSTPHASTTVALCCFQGVVFVACFSCYLTASFLANYSAFVQTDILSGTRKYASPNPHIALSPQRVVLFMKGCR